MWDGGTDGRMERTSGWGMVLGGGGGSGGPRLVTVGAGVVTGGSRGVHVAASLLPFTLPDSSGQLPWVSFRNLQSPDPTNSAHCSH